MAEKNAHLAVESSREPSSLTTPQHLLYTRIHTFLYGPAPRTALIRADGGGGDRLRPNNIHHSVYTRAHTLYYYGGSRVYINNIHDTNVMIAEQEIRAPPPPQLV